MHAERDDEGFRPIRKSRERRLAYEIAIGIFIGGSALILVQWIGAAVSAVLILEGVNIKFGG